MHRPAPARPPPFAPPARPIRRRLVAWGLAWVLAVLWPVFAVAQQVELENVQLQRGDDGLTLGFTVQFELPRGVEDALAKGVPLHFVAEAELFRERWYWRDRRVSGATRTWRVAYQPLTRQYRVSFGGLSQNFDNLADALAGVRRVGAWKLAEPGQLEDGVRHYVELRWQLDTSQLPRPMQIGIGGQTDWTLRIERVLRVN